MNLLPILFVQEQENNKFQYLQYAFTQQFR